MSIVDSAPIYHEPRYEEQYIKSLDNTVPVKDSVQINYMRVGEVTYPPSVLTSTWTPQEPLLDINKPAPNYEGMKADTSVATKLDTGKTNWTLVPFEAVEEIAKVLEFGALKYDGWNFAKGAGMNWSRIANSLLRHTFAWMRGEDNDPESGLSHLGHIGCNVIFLIYYAKYKTVFGAGDDRFKR